MSYYHDYLFDYTKYDFELLVRVKELRQVHNSFTLKFVYV